MTTRFFFCLRCHFFLVAPSRERRKAITRARARLGLGTLTRPTWFRARTAASSAPGGRGPGRRRPFAGGGGRLEGAAVTHAASPLPLA
jgi:hypothetical protein